MSPFASDFVSIGPSPRRRVRIADGSFVPVLGEGTVLVRGMRDIPVALTRVLYVPDLGSRLLSIAGLYDRGGRVVWGPEVVEIYGSRPGPHLLECRRRGSMWYLTAPVITSAVRDPTEAHCLSCSAAASAATDRPLPWEVWHQRLAHVSPSGLAVLRSRQLVSGMSLKGSIPKEHACAACFRGKMAQLPFPQSAQRVTTPLALIGMDLLGKLERESARSRARYMLLLKDYATGFTWGFFLRKKKDAAERIRHFFSFAERQFHTPIQAFRSDRGGEFLSSDFVHWLSEHGVVHQLTVPYTPQQNGMVERTNRTLCGRARAMLYAAGLPKRFWEHALRYAIWCANRVPSKRLGKAGNTPYGALVGRVPDVSMARIFGCLAHVYVPAAQRRKLDDRAVLGVFLGMAGDSKAYEFWIPETGQFLLSRSAVFHEQQFLRDAPRVDPAVTVIPPPGDLLESADDPSLFPTGQSLSKDRVRAAQIRSAPLWAEPGPSPSGPSELDVVVPPSDRVPPDHPSSSSGPHSGLSPGEGEGGVRRSSRVSWRTPLLSVRRFHPSSFARVSQDTDESVASEQISVIPAPVQSGRYQLLADLDPESVPISAEGLPSEEEVTVPSDMLRPEAVPDVPESQEPVPSLDPAPVVSEGQGELPSQSDPVVQEPRAPVPHSVESGPSGESEGEEMRGSVPVVLTPSSGPVESGTQQSPAVVIELADQPPPPAERAARPQRERRQPLHFSPVMRGQSHHIYRRAGTAVSFLSSVPPERWQVPKGFLAAMRHPDSDRYHAAMQAEFDGLIDQGVWVLVERSTLPPNAHILRCHWVYTIKLNPDNTIERYKARLVIDGSQQKEGIDYGETFASTAGRVTVRVFMAIAVLLGWVVHQLDVSQAFLYGDVDRPVYMFQPQGFTDGTSRVCLLKRSLYGLKQAPRIWSEHLRKTMLELGFTVSPMDPALYVIVKDGVFLAVLDWVDDMLLGSPSVAMLEWFKQALAERYKVKDLGPAAKYVGFEFHWAADRESLYVHQTHYCLEAFELHGDPSAPFPDTPLPTNFKSFHPWESLSPDGDREPPPGVTLEPPVSTEEWRLFRQIVGKLNFAAQCARPDIGFAAAILSQVAQKPRARHLAAARRCIQYLGGTATWGLRYSKIDDSGLLCYCDASLGPTGSSHNHTGVILSFCGSPVSWLSKKQDRMTTSTCDSESLAVMTAVQHTVFLRDLLVEFAAVQKVPTPLYNDNSACVKLCVEPRAHHKSIHLTRPMAYVRQLASDGYISPLYTPTTQMPADTLTKNLDSASFQRCRSQMGMVPLPADVTFATFPASGPPAPERGGVLDSVPSTAPSSGSQS